MSRSESWMRFECLGGEIAGVVIKKLDSQQDAGAEPKFDFIWS